MYEYINKYEFDMDINLKRRIYEDKYEFENGYEYEYKNEYEYEY